MDDDFIAAIASSQQSLETEWPGSRVAMEASAAKASLVTKVHESFDTVLRDQMNGKPLITFDNPGKGNCLAYVSHQMGNAERGVSPSVIATEKEVADERKKLLNKVQAMHDSKGHNFFFSEFRKPRFAS